MTRQQYNTLITQAAEAKAIYGNQGLDTYLTDTCATVLDRYGDNLDQLVADLTNIYWVANATAKDIKTAAKLTVPAMADRFMIPARAVTNWCAPSINQEAPAYLRLLMAESLGLVTVTIID